jgi:lysophospholipase L1-like esterase
MHRLSRWSEARSRARAGQGAARLLMLGDSTTFGYGAQGGAGHLRTPYSVPAQIAALVTASRAVRAQANGWMGLSLPAGDPRITLGTGWTATASPPSLGGATVMATEVGSVLSFSPGAPVDHFTIYHIASPGNGAFLVDVDGTGAVPVDSRGPARIAAFTLCVRPGRHTLNITSSALASGIFIVGCEAGLSAEDQVVVIGAGWQGAASAQIADDREYWSSANVIGQLRPDLTTINVGINDWYGDVPIAQFAAGVQSLVRAAAACGDVALFAPTPTNPAIVPAATQRSYVQALAQIADANAIPLIDLAARFGSWESANGRGWMNDDVHPNARGYAEVAAAAVAALFP